MSKEVKVGILVVVASTVLYLGFNFLKGEDFFSDNVEYYAIYPNVAGLTKGNPVIINGFIIGRVDNLELLSNKENTVRVSFKVKNDIPIGDGTIAELANDGLLGGKAIRLILGVNKEIYNGDKELETRLEKDLVGLIQEKTIPVIEGVEALISSVKSKIDTFDVKKAEQEAYSAIDNIKELTASLNKVVLINNQRFGALSKEFIATSKNVNGLLSNDVKPLLKSVTTLTDSLKTLDLNKSLASLEKSTVMLNLMLEKINSGDGTVSKLMNEPDLHNNLVETLASINCLVQHLNSNPKHFLGPLAKSKKKIEKECEGPCCD